MEIKRVKKQQQKDKIKKQKGFLMPPHPLTNFEIQKYYQNELYSRDNLQKIKDGAYVVNLDEYSDIGTLILHILILSE